MGWSDRWVWGNEGRGPSWSGVALWAGAVAVFEVGLISAFWHDGSAAAFLVVASIASWIWVLRSFRHPGRPNERPAIERPAPRSRITPAPGGHEYEIVVQPSPRRGSVSTPTRMWNTLTRDQTWWVTVEGDRWPWPVLRERFFTEAMADERADELDQAISAGELHLTRPAWRRRTRRRPLD